MSGKKKGHYKHDRRKHRTTKTIVNDVLTETYTPVVDGDVEIVGDRALLSVLWRLPIVIAIYPIWLFSDLLTRGLNLLLDDLK